MSTHYTDMSYRDVAPDYNAINYMPDEAGMDIAKAVRDLLNDGACLLDIGCGAGRIAVPVAASGLMVTGLDLESKMLRAAKKRASDLGAEATWVEGDVTNLPFGDDQFDAVMTTSVLHLVTEWKTALREAARVLKPGGLFIIGRNILDEECCAGRIRKQLRRVAGEADPAIRPTEAAGPGLFVEIQSMGGEMARPIEATKWTERTSPAELMDKIRTRRHNETWALSEETHRVVVEAMGPWISDSFDDAEKTENVASSFTLYPVKGLAQA